jgi:bifunctional UDP-N-acetylglucosamine pyrophosphorylase/glucosamine-1-phosphate N-acetyltransferase
VDELGDEEIMTDKTVIVILGAGNGTRMCSTLPKVMHQVAGKAMITYLTDLAAAMDPQQVVCVVGPNMEMVEEVVKPYRCVIQPQQLGSGNAVLVTEGAVEDSSGTVIVLYGDSPLITKATLERMVAEKSKGFAGIILGFRPDDTKKYGRLVLAKDGTLERIVEFKDATPEERAIDFCNSGIMCVDARPLYKYLKLIGNNNAAGEYYLFDIIELMRQDGLKFGVVEGDPAEVEGANTREELANLEMAFQNRMRRQCMAGGVTLQDPATTYFSADTTVGKDTLVEPGVYFGPGVKIGKFCKIRAFQRLHDIEVKDGESV